MNWFPTVLAAAAIALPLTMVEAQTTARGGAGASGSYRTSAYRGDFQAANSARSSTAGAANESLFDVRSARQLSRQTRQQESMTSRFGPKAGNFRYDARMLRAAKIAESRAKKHSQRRCWRYVKTALLEADVIDFYPKTAYAKQAAHELTSEHGFKRLPIRDPFKAPVGSVLVYGGRGPGHVEIRTADGFVSDFESEKPSKRPLIGVYVKPDQRANQRNRQQASPGNRGGNNGNGAFGGQVQHRSYRR